MSFLHHCLLITPLASLLMGCAEPTPATPSKSPSAVARNEPEAQPEKITAIEKIPTKYLPNAVRVHAKVISGGLPEGDEAFAELHALGIKTIISVDGAKPDLVAAEKFGMRYVHLPHGYDGVPQERAWELAKAVRDLPGPIYLHCHHGKHRSPAAAAVACVGAGMIGHADAATVLQVAGTGAGYRGLFQSAESAQPLDRALLNELQADFPAVAKLPAMAQTMVMIEQVHDHLKKIEKAGWKTPVDHPALVPAHEALLLREHFTEMARMPEVQAKSAAFQSLTSEAETTALALEEALKSSQLDVDHASKLLGVVKNNCQSCHQQFRDIPLNEKQAAR